MNTFTFTSPRGHELSARYDGPIGHEKATAIFAHCFTCSKDLRVERQIVSSFVAKGIGVLTFDFTGLGRSGGEFGETTFSADVQDIVAAAEVLANRVASPAILVGHSLGGAAVLHAAAAIKSVRAVVTIGAPADPGHIKQLFKDGIDEIEKNGQAEVNIGGRPFTVGKQFINDLEKQDSVKVIGSLKSALLVFHSPTDNIVGVENARLIYDAARHPKSFISLDGADHLLSNPDDAAYVATVAAAWAGRYVTGVGEDTSTSSDSNSDKRGGTAAAGTARANDETYANNIVRATTESGFATDITARGFVLRGDEPASVGGTQTGPTPYDFLGAALATCTSMTLRMYADRKKLKLDRVTTSVSHRSEHAKDCASCENSGAKIAVLDRTLELVGDLTDAERTRLTEIADRCPVHRTLEGEIDVRTSLL